MQAKGRLCRFGETWPRATLLAQKAACHSGLLGKKLGSALGRRADGAWLVETRPDKGLLGGMLGWPGSEWSEEVPAEAPPVAANWRDIGGEVRHTFTHFHLRLRVMQADLAMETAPDRGFFEPAFRASELPTVMRKAHALAIDQMAADAK